MPAMYESESQWHTADTYCTVTIQGSVFTPSPSCTLVRNLVTAITG